MASTASTDKISMCIASEADCPPKDYATAVFHRNDELLIDQCCKSAEHYGGKWRIYKPVFFSSFKIFLRCLTGVKIFISSCTNFRNTCPDVEDIAWYRRKDSI